MRPAPSPPDITLKQPHLDRPPFTTLSPGLRLHRIDGRVRQTRFQEHPNVLEDLPLDVEPHRFVHCEPEGKAAENERANQDVSERGGRKASAETRANERRSAGGGSGEQEEKRVGLVSKGGKWMRDLWEKRKGRTVFGEACRPGWIFGSNSVSGERGGSEPHKLNGEGGEGTNRRRPGLLGGLRSEGKGSKQEQSGHAGKKKGNDATYPSPTPMRRRDPPP